MRGSRYPLRRDKGRRGVSVLLLAFLVGIGLVLAYGPSFGGSAARKIRIEEGMSVMEIADLLKNEGIIRSTTTFRALAFLRGDAKKLRTGTYILNPDQSLPQIIELLLRGASQEVRITIPEGFTVADIDALLARNGLMEAGDIIACAVGALPREARQGEVGCDFSSFEFLPKSSGRITPWRSGMPESVGSMLEGYLFPDTYFVEVESFVPKFFLERQLTTFRHRVLEPFGQEIETSGRSLHEITTVASLVERETRTDAERLIVAGILWKRFDAGRSLDVDATIRYALGKKQGILTKDDLDAPTLYNTRRHRGLPPGPIGNAGLESILSSLRPEDSPYWYYLHDSSGQIHYAETNEEHNENKARHLR